MIINTSQQKWARLSTKQLDNQFLNEIIKGMNCSQFEAKAILDTVHKVYSDFFNYSEPPQPGQAKFIVTSAAK
jgi:AAA+ ATPase superfamily predicted ATPase